MEKIKNKIKLFKEKAFFLSSFFILVLLIIYGIFPVEDKFQQTIAPLVFFVIIPCIYIKFILKKPLMDFGLRFGDYKQGLIWSGIGLFISIALLFLMIKYTSLSKNYFIPSDIIDNFWNFLVFELGITLFFISIYEFFFRGFIMFYFEQYVGIWAIALQFLIFLILVLILGSNSWMFAPYLLFAPFAGLITFKSRSILYSIISQLVLIIFMDASIIHLFK